MPASPIRPSLLKSHLTTWHLRQTLLPLHARLSTVSNTLETEDIPAPLLNSSARTSKFPSSNKAPPTFNPRIQAKINAQAIPTAQLLEKSASIESKSPSRSTEPSIPLSLSEDTKTLIPLLTAQAPHYISAHIYDRPYLVTKGDLVRLPFLMKDVNPGDVLRLNRASLLGSRDYTLKAGTSGSVGVAKELRQKGLLEGLGGGRRDTPYLDERLFVCRATVVGTESEPMRIMEKTKRRQRHIKHVMSKHRYTVLRISELQVKTLDELEKYERIGEA